MFVGMKIVDMIHDKPHIIIGVGAVMTGFFGTLFGRDVNVVCGAMCAATVLMEAMHYRARKEKITHDLELEQAIKDAKEIIKGTYEAVADEYPDGGAHLIVEDENTDNEENKEEAVDEKNV